MKTVFKNKISGIKKTITCHRFCIVFTLTGSLLISSLFISQNQRLVQANNVLGKKTVQINKTENPSPTLHNPHTTSRDQQNFLSPTPTPGLKPNPSPQTILNTPTPSPTPAKVYETATPSPTPVATPTPTPSSSPTATPLATPNPSPSEIPTPTPSSNSINVSLTINYHGVSDKQDDLYQVNIETGKTAWDAMKKAVGVENIQYTDYGKDLGIFITGINGIVPAGNQYWEFDVNGAAASTGVSNYVLLDNDKIEFKIVQW